MVISWILNTISDQISNSLSFVNTAKELWSELQEHYSQLDGHRIYQLTNDIAQLKQSNCTVEIYYHKLKGYWDEVDALEAPHICTCVCTCENGKNNTERDQRKRLMQFLMGLDECYANIRGQILLMNPLPTVAKAYGMVRQEEKQRENFTPKTNTGSIALSTYTNNYKNNNTGSRWNNNTKYTPSTSTKYTLFTLERKSSYKKGVYFDNCGLKGHLKVECYKIVSYPVGQPLHGKYPLNNKASQPSTSNTKKVNMVIGNENCNDDDMTMAAGMDQLQNQVNQVLIMMQNAQQDMSKDQNKRIAHGTLCNGLYIIKQDNTLHHPSINQLSTAQTSSPDEATLWHSRLGHPSIHVMKNIKNIPCVIKSNNTITTCTICPLSKQHALPFPDSHSHASSLFSLVHIDV
ncbi:uncharacterized protein [Rutidosis leptorrhynchoides]|uniref:uncharacterized protein n=1 Tax=Rutidosis leptorrhynchoides TaxID=125765 RepID=UPI003A9A16B7